MSNNNATLRAEPSNDSTQRRLSTRLPTRSITPTTAAAKSVTTAPAAGKLHKKKPAREIDMTSPSRIAMSSHTAKGQKSAPSQSRDKASRLAPPTAHTNISQASSRLSLQPYSSRSRRLEVHSNARTPSLVSGSSAASTNDSPRSVLRRKASSIGRPAPRLRRDSASSQDDTPVLRTVPGHLKDPFQDSVFGISMPPMSGAINRSHEATGTSNNLNYAYAEDHYAVASDILPPPTPAYASATPSTGYSESPQVPSQVSTPPTLLSSPSPGLPLAGKTSRTRQASPLQNRPPLSRVNTDMSEREQKSLFPVRESSTSSSSASTVRHVDAARSNEGAAFRGYAQKPASTVVTQQQLLQRPIVGVPPPRTSSIRRPALQNPPELAHLAVDNLPIRSHSRKPSRPSRDGTPEIVGLQQQSPVIQSNMSSLPMRHRRGSSGDSRIGMSPLSASNNAESVAALSKLPSKGPSSTSIPTGTASLRRLSSRGATPELHSDGEKSVKSVTAPSPVKSGSRFGLFRRAKPETPAVVKPEKKLRKGPMAGTGHEGYGKYANRGRSNSSTSGLSVGRSPSTDSTDATTVQNTPSSRKSSFASPKDSDVDDYFRDRMTPVIIRGGSADMCRTPDEIRSQSSLDSNRGELTTEANPNGSSYSSEFATAVEISHAKPTLLPSAMPNPRTQSPLKRFGFGFGSRRPSDSDNEKKAGLVTASTRRTSRIVEPTTTRKAKPAAINTAGITSVLPLDSARSGRFSMSDRSDAKASVDLGDGKEGKWLKSKKAEVRKEIVAPKPAKKWTFWQRAAAAQAPTKKEIADSTANIVKALPARSVAHYALDDEDQLDLNTIEQIMAEAATSPEKSTITNQHLQVAPRESSVEVKTTKQHVPSMLLPSPPLPPPSFAQPARSASPKVKLSKNHNTSRYDTEQRLVTKAAAVASPLSPDEAAAECERRDTEPADLRSDDEARANIRLAQIGRIPRVISKRDQDRKLSDHSFSRPFAPSQPPPKVHGSRASVDSTQAPPLSPGSTVLSDAYPAYGGGLSSPFNQALFDLSPLGTVSDPPEGEFFQMPPRKMSEQSCSGSSGMWSLPAAPAIIPSYDSPLSEDEVWNEYNEFIDEVLSPATDTVVSPSAYLEAAPQESLQVSSQLTPVVNHSAHTSISSNPQSVHLRRSRLLSALNMSSPKSSIAVSEVYSSFGDQSLSVVDPVTGRLSLGSQRGSVDTKRQDSHRTSLQNVRMSQSTASSNGDRRRSSRYRDTKLIEMAENEKDGLENMANLRLAALMTSKWLSFGHVLFSPINLELKDAAEDSVLVVDGLGKDWSHYCALTYSEATIYNLSTSATGNANKGPLSGGLPNHRSIHHTSLMSAFPFPRGFFAAVVYRFPLAHPEAVYRHAVNECKRVLRPGGFLEMSVLDLDLVNMGNRARRAVRSLKVQMQTDDPAVSLNPVSDMVMKFVHRRGFENVKSCIVAVPVAAGRFSISSSESSETDTAPARSARALGKQKAVNSTLKAQSTEQKEKRRISHLAPPPANFQDLLNAPPSPDPAAASETNANISSHVARVGRWWHSRCYENLGTHDDQDTLSLWSDGALLRECEKRGTGFRLLVAYAQKPAETVRRTVSV